MRTNLAHNGRTGDAHLHQEAPNECRVADRERATASGPLFRESRAQKEIRHARREIERAFNKICGRVRFPESVGKAQLFSVLPVANRPFHPRFTS